MEYVGVRLELRCNMTVPMINIYVHRVMALQLDSMDSMYFTDSYQELILAVFRPFFASFKI